MSNKLKNIVGIICLLCIFISIISIKKLNAAEFPEYKAANFTTKGNWTFVQLCPIGIFSADFSDLSKKLSFLPEILDSFEKEQNLEIKDYKIMSFNASNYLSYCLLIRHTPK